MISILSKGDQNKIVNGLRKIAQGKIFTELDRYGQVGVSLLSSATPVDSGLSSHSWAYRVIKNINGPGIEWYNTNVVNGTPVVILIQYGHGTGTGGYVQGRDFINPVLRPLFDQIANDIWKKVKS